MYRKALALLAWSTLASAAEEAEVAPSEWLVMSELGAGYDTNANGSTRAQSFLGFQLDPRYLAAKSPFAEASLSAEYTANVAPQRGFISSMHVGHRVNPDASF